MKILNYTPHTINVCNENNEVVSSFESVGCARISTTQKEEYKVDGIQVMSTVYGEVEGLPEQEDGVMYLVSFMVVNALPNRKDLIAPNTSPQACVRDEEGKIIGVRSFQC